MYSTVRRGGPKPRDFRDLRWRNDVVCGAVFLLNKRRKCDEVVWGAAIIAEYGLVIRNCLQVRPQFFLHPERIHETRRVPESKHPVGVHRILLAYVDI